MTESPGNEPSKELFAQVRQMIETRGVDIKVTLSGNALRLEFADGQRILINLDPHTHNVWLAARSGGHEFIHHRGTWQAQDGSEFLASLRKLVEQTIASNPINASTAGAKAAPPPPVVYYVAEKSHGLRNLLIVLLAAMIGFWAALRLSAPAAPPPSLASTAQTQAAASGMPGRQQCEGGFPANGSITLFPESGMRAAGPNDPEITLQNDHTYPLLLILTAPQTAIPAMSILVHARQSVSVRVPAGQYDMLFAVGNTWCNMRSGFSDGHILKFDKTLTVQMDKPMQLIMQSSGGGADDFHVFVKQPLPEAAMPPPTFTGDGSMEVQRQTNGHFYLPATIENVPVTFMVDTGATITSISSEIARQAGIRDCKEVQFQTANGAATGCVALVAHMTLGNFELQNITVAVMPNMETNLLGANVLRNFQVNQGDSSMLIGRR